MDPTNNVNPTVNPPIMSMQPLSPSPVEQTLYVEEQPHHKHVSRMVIVTVFVLLTGIVSFVFFQRFASTSKAKIDPKNQPNQQIPQSDLAYLKDASINTDTISKTPISPMPVAKQAITDPQAPWFMLISEDNKNTYAVGEEMHFIIKGFSQTKDINGYDVLLGFDPEMMDVLSIESMPQTFSLKQIQKKTHVTITGYKSLEVKTPTVLNDDGLIKITAVSKKSGNIKLELIPEVKKEKTKMVDNKVQVIAPQLQSIEVAIQ